MFEKKFEIGEIVKIKKGTKPKSLKIDLSGWQGRVKSIEGKAVEIEWDLETLENLPREYLDSCENEGSYPFVMYLPKKDLEEGNERDTEKEVWEEQDRIFSKLEAIYGGGYMEEVRKWIWQFERSSFYKELEEIEQGNVGFTVETFTDYMYNYEGQEPGEWTVNSMEEVCLEVVPRKVSGEEDLFLSYGKVLGQFFEFLAKEEILKTRPLITRLKEISDQIFEYSQNPSNWGMAKSLMMGAQASGVDVGDQGELNEYMLRENLRKLTQVSRDSEIKEFPQRRINPYRKIGRNEKISVRYNDGKEVRNVKFKKVAKDLQNGICELIEEESGR